MRKATFNKRIKALEAENTELKTRIGEMIDDAIILSDEFDAFARAHSLAANTGVDTNSRLAASRRGRAKSYNECADKLRSRFKIRQPEGDRDA